MASNYLTKKQFETLEQYKHHASKTRLEEWMLKHVTSKIEEHVLP